jgi:hypothetical protein
LEQRIQNVGRHAKTCLLQARNSIRKIYQPTVGGFRQNPERSDHNQVSLRCIAARRAVVFDEPIGVEFFGQRDGFALSRTQVFDWEVGGPLDGPNLESGGRAIQARTACGVSGL